MPINYCVLLAFILSLYLGLICLSFFACPFCSPLQAVYVSHFVVLLCCCSFSSRARIIVPLLCLCEIPTLAVVRKFRINFRLLDGRGNGLK